MFHAHLVLPNQHHPSVPHIGIPPQSAPSSDVSNYIYLSSQFCAGRCSFHGNTTHPHLCHFHQCLKLCPHGPCLAPIPQTASKTCLVHQYSDLFQNDVHVCSVQTTLSCLDDVQQSYSFSGSCCGKFHCFEGLKCANAFPLIMTYGKHSYAIPRLSDVS